MKTSRPMTLAILALGALALALPVAKAATLVPYKSTWQYTFTQPVGTAWMQTMGTGSGGWTSGPAPFGNVGNSGYGGNTDFVPGTVWPESTTSGADLWVRHELDLTNFDLSAVNWALGVDNGYALYINGNFVGSNFAEGYATLAEYTGTFNSSFLFSGINTIALELDDTGSFTAFDMTVSATPVPEPGTYGLMGAAGLAGLMVWRRRRKA